MPILAASHPDHLGLTNPFLTPLLRARLTSLQLDPIRHHLHVGQLKQFAWIVILIVYSVNIHLVTLHVRVLGLRLPHGLLCGITPLAVAKAPITVSRVRDEILSLLKARLMMGAVRALRWLPHG